VLGKRQGSSLIPRPCGMLGLEQGYQKRSNIASTHCTGSVAVHIYFLPTLITVTQDPTAFPCTVVTHVVPRSQRMHADYTATIRNTASHIQSYYTTHTPKAKPAALFNALSHTYTLLGFNLRLRFFSSMKWISSCEEDAKWLKHGLNASNEVISQRGVGVRTLSNWF